jgi:two-component system, cell cycle response regulator
MQTNQYRVDVIGFNDTERLMLSSIFGLAARRDPCFMQFDPLSGEAANLFLVDADDPAAMGEFTALSKLTPLPTVMVGSTNHGTEHPLTARPLQWARLLQVFEDAVEQSVDDQISVDPEPAQLHRQIVSKAGVAATPLLRNSAGASDANKAIGDTVLVVDDNATVRMFMQAKLAPYRFDVDFAETGEQAIGLTGSREYTCVFLDVILPGIDGYQVCKLIKSNKQAIKRTAVVMLTSRSSPFDKLRGSLAGCDEYLTKPLDENRLLEVIAKFLPTAEPQK